MVDLANVVEVGVTILPEDIRLHSGAIYELACGEVLDQHQVAAILSQALARPVRAEMISRDQWRSGVQAAGLSDYTVETLE